MWKPSNREQFLACVSELMFHEDIQAMEDIPQHIEGISCLDHSICVAYLSFLMCRKLKLNFTAAARGGLLHDLHLKDWEKEKVGVFKRLVIHPEMALENAEKFSLSEVEKDIIVKHMWPITITKIPRFKEAAIVSLADKLCTLAEVFRFYKKKKIKANTQAIRETT